MFKNKKFSLVIALLILGILAVGHQPAFAGESLWYSETVSTHAVTDAGAMTPDIDLARVQIQSAGIWHVTAATETYLMYELAGDTNTITAVGKIYCPATIGWYPFFGEGVFLTGNVLTGADMVNVPELYIRHGSTSPTATHCPNDTMQIIYKR